MGNDPGRYEVAPLQPSAVRWRVLALLLAFSFLSWFNRTSISVAYNARIQEQLGITPQEIGFVYSALLFAYMLCMTPGGWFVDRRGPWLALVLMGLGSAFFCALTGVVGLMSAYATTVLVLLLIVRAAMGVFTAPIYPASGRAVASWLPERQRASANGAIMGAALLGIASTYFGFGALVDWFDWPAAFVCTGAVTALVALLWFWCATNTPAQHPGVNEAERQWIHSRPGDLSLWSAPQSDEDEEDEFARPFRFGEGAAGRGEATEFRPGPPPEPRLLQPATAPAAAQPEAMGSVWRLLRHRSLMLLTVSYAAIGYFEYLFYFWMEYYFDGVLHLGKAESRTYATILFVAMAAGMFAGGWLSDWLAGVLGRRLGRALVVVSGMLGGALLLGLGILAPEAHWTVMCFALAMAAVGATEGPFWATAVDLGGRHGGTAAGFFNTGGNAGGMLAPALTPVVSAACGWVWGIALGGIVCFVGAILWIWIDPEQR